MLATSPSTTIVDSWSRSPDADLRPHERKDLLAALDAEEAADRLTGVGRMLRAIAFCGTSAPLARVAAVMGVSRRQAGRIWKEAEEREIGRGYEIPRNFGACTHVKDAGTKGHAGRAECEKLRREAGLEEGGCTAHHGHKIRTLVDGLTPVEIVRRLRRPASEIKARLAARTRREEVKREELGTPANDLEAKRWAGLPVERGRKGTNHVRHQKRAHVTPIPDLRLKDPDTSSLSVTGGVTFDSEPGVQRRASGAPTAPEVVATHNEPSPPPTAPTRLHESCGEEDRERIVPTKVVPISTGRVIAKIRDWFCREWMGRGLGPLNRSDLNRLWVVCERELTRDELRLALEHATRLALVQPRKLFVRVFGKRAELHECVHKERMRRVQLEGSKAKRGGAPMRAEFDEARPGGTGPDQSAGGRGAPPSPVRPLAPPVVISEEEAARRRAEQRAILEALIAEELVEIPIVGDVK